MNLGLRGLNLAHEYQPVDSTSLIVKCFDMAGAATCAAWCCCRTSQDRMVTTNQLAGMVAEIAGVRIVTRRVPGQQGVRGRNSDNNLLRSVLGWEAVISLEEGLARAYRWIGEQVSARLATRKTRS
jgi:hypothetical protein